MRFDSPAKINLHLRVGAVRPDGFHPLHTWMVTVGLFDTLDFLHQTGPSASGGGRLTINCTDPLVPTDDQNLIARAARLLQENSVQRVDGAFDDTCDDTFDDICVELAKSIPMGGGLGGGSSNAATALVALNALWKLNLPPQRLDVLAAQLGSDVPFFLHGPSSVCTGRGEVVRPIAPPACRWAVLILPGMAMPTAAVYRRLDTLLAEESVSGTLQSDFADEPFSSARGAVQRPLDADDPASWTDLPAEDLLSRLMNDLEAPAFDIRPDLAVLRQSAEQIVGRPVRMSGSGSTLFTLFDTKNGADVAVQQIAERSHVEGLPINGLPVRAIAVRIAP